MIESKYIVPFLYIPYGSKVVIYGGGKWGEYYYRKIKSDNCVEIVAILDAQAKKLPKIFENTPIYEPNKIYELQFDYVLIAVEDAKHANHIKHILYDYDVPDSKIVWAHGHACMNKSALYEIMKCFDRNIESQNRRLFLFMLPEHGNLGDYAIGYAEFSFFEKYFSQYEVYGITTSEWLEANEFYLNIIKSGDVIFFNGGGFLGDLWENTKVYMHIVESFPQNIKIFFPNSLTYKEKPCKENNAFMKDIEWFKNQNNLFVFFREYPSYRLFHKYEKRCCLFPDMAFYLCYERDEFHKQNKILLCMRRDREKIFDKKDKLENSLKNAGIEYDACDICMERYISQQAGRRLLHDTIQLFQSYDCVITDRLHGMILSAISNVPCIAFDNHTHKISGVFATIKDLQYLRVITTDEIDNIGIIMNTLYENKQKMDSYKPPIKKFEKMADVIYKIMNYIGESNEKYS